MSPPDQFFPLRKDDWPDKRMNMDDRYRSDFGRQDRYQDFDHRDRGRYHDDMRGGGRGMGGDRDGPVRTEIFPAHI